MDSKVARAILALCLALFVVRAYASLRQDSATFDETNYFGIGKYLLQTGRWDVPGSILHPPLFYYLSSLPLMFADTDPAVWRRDPAKAGDLRYLASGDIPRGQALLASPANDDNRLLASARLTMVATAVLLACFVFAWSARLYGAQAAALATVLFTCCPNILANARLMTPDILVTTFMFITVYYLWRLLHTGRLPPAILGGVSLGLALLCKFTALLLLPILLGLVILWRVVMKKTNWAGCAILFGCGLALLVIGYGGHQAPFWGGLKIQGMLASEGHPSFLLGKVSEDGWWYYLIVAFFVKTPLAAIALLGLALYMTVGRSRPATHWIDVVFLLAPVVVVVAFFSANHQSIGLRYILPVYPFLFVFISQVVRPDALSVGRKIAIGALTCWYVGASIWIHPHYLAYFNELVGGPRNGYKVLVDSNLDWGQGLKELKRYMTTHGIGKISLSYFGTDSPERYGIVYVALPSFLPLHPAVRERPDPDGWFAVSATNLQGVYFGDRDPNAGFRALVPDAMIGYSILLYHLKKPEPRSP